jgi:hypothetical protein
MASEKQIAANRQNARRSTGPQTPEGKARASINALRHGFRAREAVIPEEDRAEYLDLIAALQAEHQASGPLEEFLVLQMASAQWRLARFTRIETGLLVARLESVRKLEYRYDDNPPEAPVEKGRTAAEEEHDEHTRILGLTFHQTCSGDAFSKLSRYENAIRRAFYKALAALRESQDRRRASAKQISPNEPNFAPESPGTEAGQTTSANNADEYTRIPATAECHVGSRNRNRIRSLQLHRRIPNRISLLPSKRPLHQMQADAPSLP